MVELWGFQVMTTVAQTTRVLLVEDEKKLARSVQAQLTQHGYEVESASDGIDAIDMTLAGDFHVVILDINLPGKSGLEVLQAIRSRSQATPVLIVSARDAVSDRIMGLTLGADDYLVKPFDSAELVARLQAILRRSGLARHSVLRAGDLTLDVVERKARRGGREINLTGREFALLEFLLRNKNQVLTRRRIAEQVWGYKFDTGTNVVGVYISYLRKIVDDGFPVKLIQTVLGEGFLLKDT
jgi:two-component system, OmpR family, copper resistance phosphate regulon response regulator CusR